MSQIIFTQSAVIDLNAYYLYLSQVGSSVMKGAAPAVKDFFSDLQLTPQTGLKLENRRKIREMIKSYRHAEYVSLYHYNEQ